MAVTGSSGFSVDDAPGGPRRRAPEEATPPAGVVRCGLTGAGLLCRLLGRGRYRVADAVGAGVYCAQRSRRERTIGNHRRRDPSIGPREARRLASSSFREYARTCADFFWASSLDPGETRAAVTVTGIEHVLAARRAGAGAVLTTTHFGNWDMAAMASAAFGMELTTVMAPIGPGWTTRAVMWLRRRQHIDVVCANDAARGLMRALRQGRFVALLADLPVTGPTVTVEYCGGPTLFSAVPARLAARVGAPLIPVACRRESAGYSLDVHAPVAVPPGASEQAVTQDIARVLEAAVDRCPAQWYPFGTVWTDRP